MQIEHGLGVGWHWAGTVQCFQVACRVGKRLPENLAAAMVKRLTAR
ncbi:hypothetical protein EIKCOROL_00467 [Eikenella corrodens ATCC 23834]|uniref:Uncharacterized protein n=1 Tax=Eikenella corrodens ATCC 23834 TaxID=546274 RepID=C0DSZ4_EIKCO|nr:hypothetical protein EIKCOROL_00467 [Eikenella corrodens ATCC 23834]